MKNNKMNKYIIWGLLINTIAISSKQFIKIPEGILCFSIGVAITLMIYGMYSTSHDITKIRNFKRNLVKKFMKSI